MLTDGNNVEDVSMVSGNLFFMDFIRDTVSFYSSKMSDSYIIILSSYDCYNFMTHSSHFWIALAVA